MKMEGGGEDGRRGLGGKVGGGRWDGWMFVWWCWCVVKLGGWEILCVSFWFWMYCYYPDYDS